MAAALGDPATVGKTDDVGGPEALDGAGVAAAFETARGAPHAYRAVPLDMFESGLARAIGPDAAREIAALYRWFNTDGSPYLSPDSEAAAALDVTKAPMHDWVAGVPWEQIAK